MTNLYYMAVQTQFNVGLNIWLDGFGVSICTWLALYIMLHGKSTFLTLVIVIGLLTQAFYFFSDNLIDGSSDNSLSLILTKVSWWSALLPLAIWFHASWIIRKQTEEFNLIKSKEFRRKLFPFRVFGVYILCALCIILGSFSNILLNYERNIVKTDNQFFVANGPFFPIVLAFIVIAGIGSYSNFNYALLLERKQPRQNPLKDASFFQNLVIFQNQLWLLRLGSFFFGFAGCYIATNQLLEGVLPDGIGYVCFFLGLTLYGYSLTTYNSLITNKEDISFNLLYSFIETIMVSAIFIGPFLIIIGLKNLASLLELDILIILAGSSIYINNFRLVLNKMVDKIIVRDELSRNVAQQERKEAVQQINSVGAIPIDINPNQSEPLILLKSNAEAFKKEVKEAFKSYTDVDKLSNSPLLRYNFTELRLKQMLAVDEPEQKKRITAIQEILEEKVRTLAPDRKKYPNIKEKIWHQYNILYYCYIKGMNKRERGMRLIELREMSNKGNINADIYNEIETLEWLNSNPTSSFYDKLEKGSETVADLLLKEFGR